KYLRRQKPVEIRKRKFSRKAWPMYRRVLAAVIFALVAGAGLYEASYYFLYSPAVILNGADQIEISGNRYVPAEAIVEKFSADMGHSVVRVPLTDRRKALESLPWIEQAAVQRVLPNRLRVSVTERTPVAYLRSAGDLSLVDSHGVILERPSEGAFRFPVVNGLVEAMPGDAREQRMNLFVQFMKEIEAAQPGADDHVSEVDLSDAADVRVTLTGLGSGSANAAPVLVHFGDSDFANRYHLLSDNVDQWRAGAGGIDSVDLRFARQVVVNPESRPAPARRIRPAPVKSAAPAHKRH
ncbi:MAG: cell division protein FtsQ/DivIB, partial [Bryobacteraceae bacterium]